MKPVFPLPRSIIAILTLACTVSAFATDVGFYGVTKQKDFTQSDSIAAPLLTGARFECFVDSTQPNVIDSASVQIPGGGSRILSADGPDSFHFREDFGSPATLNAAYGTGTYTLQVYSENDIYSFAQLSMPSDAYGPAPFLTNFVAAQSIDAASNFTLYWSPFTGGTANDIIEVSVQDSIGNEVFSSKSPGAGSLDGTSTSFVIPANTLSTGQNYTTKVSFYKIVVFDTSSIPGGTGVVAFGTRTSFNIHTGTPSGTGNINFYAVIKQQDFEQSSDGGASYATNQPYRFQAFVETSASNVVTGASVQLPGGTSSHTLQSGGDDSGLSFEEGFDSLSALNGAYPSGNYTMNISTPSTNYSVSLSLPSGFAVYPDYYPYLTNFSAAQSINPSNSFTLNWNAFAGGTTNDYMQVQITTLNDQMTIYSSPQPNDPGALNGTSPTSLVIPANTLAPGTAYRVELLFARAMTIDRTNIPAALGFSSYVKRTRTSIATTGTAPVVQLQPIGMVNGHFQFKFSSQPGHGYQIQWSDNLPSWGNLSFTNATSTETIFSDTFGVNSHRFYRVQEQ